MSDPRAPSNLIQALAERLDETIGPETAYFDSGKALRALNQAQADIVRFLGALDRGRFLTSFELSLVGGQQEYALPTNCLAVKGVEVATESSELLWPNRRLRYVPFRDKDLFDYMRTGVEAGDLVWSFRDGSLIFFPPPSRSLPGALRVWHTRTPAEMSIGTASAGAAAALTLEAQPTVGQTISLDDYYKGSSLLLTAGMGVGQTAEIAAYNGSTLEATVSGNWQTAPDKTSEYEILSMVPIEHLEILILGGVRRIRQIDADMETWQATYGQDFERQWLAMRRAESRRQTSHANLTTRLVFP